MSELKQKLSSRKFWAAVAAFVTSVGAMIGWEAGTTERIVALVSAVGVLVAYIFVEGWADAEGMKPSSVGEIINSYYGDEYIDKITDESPDVNKPPDESAGDAV
ncbi:hypothetical protein FACS1894184_17190 [Clostridia bacterium]|nr:hypothetical protein FACS1894184_17190 [Clostridia bacterium]